MLRKARGISQRQLAEATGINQSEISRIERGVGNPTEDTPRRIGRLLEPPETPGPAIRRP